jgi:hypothetical protein
MVATTFPRPIADLKPSDQQKSHFWLLRLKIKSHTLKYMKSIKLVNHFWSPYVADQKIHFDIYIYISIFNALQY